MKRILIGLLVVLALAVPAHAIVGTPSTRQETITVTSATAVGIANCLSREGALAQVRDNQVYFTFRSDQGDPGVNDFLGDVGSIIEIERPLLFKAIAVSSDALVKVQCFER